ncbi:hypothetical protein BKA70DRAFT_1372447 [Coprinopsis sp. MPI-PUGE-AT-0042]|nr:hypothetical protein BKA70DRAFT_1372447 [Coprinopsis sp. MPI-PUGE-AT-0042]
MALQPLVTPQQAPPNQPSSEHRLTSPVPHRARNLTRPRLTQQPSLGGQAYTDAYNGAAPGHGSKPLREYPDLNPILAIDTTNFGSTSNTTPQSEILASTWYGYRTSPAKAPQHGGHATSYMRLISHKFPWSIDIKLPPAIYHALQQPLEDSEWGMIVMDRKARERVEGAMKKRMEAAPSSPPGPKRIDYLGDSTLFKGLEKDGEFIKLRTMPGEGVAPETWVLKITS